MCMYGRGDVHPLNTPSECMTLDRDYMTIDVDYRRLQALMRRQRLSRYLLAFID
jgi:NADPH-dependent 7-cyano-7-deazaguanine reductase QueF